MRGVSILGSKVGAWSQLPEEGIDVNCMGISLVLDWLVQPNLHRL